MIGEEAMEVCLGEAIAHDVELLYGGPGPAWILRVQVRFDVDVVQVDRKAVVELAYLSSYVRVFHPRGDLPLIAGGKLLDVDAVYPSCYAPLCDFPSGTDEFYGFDSCIESLIFGPVCIDVFWGASGLADSSCHSMCGSALQDPCSSA